MVPVGLSPPVSDAVSFRTVEVLHCWLLAPGVVLSAGVAWRTEVYSAEPPWSGAPRLFASPE
jgi:hypothetical protein